MLSSVTRGVVMLCVAAVVLAGCSSVGSSDSAGSRTVTTPAYGNPGPFQVGVTTLDLGSAGARYGERLATVFYPAELDSAQLSGRARFSYTQAETLPASLKALLPASYNSTTIVNAYPDVSGSSKGPFPVVLFSHGLSAQRLFYSSMLAGIASWGYVVISPDFLERGLAALAQGITSTPPPSLDQAIMARALEMLRRASSQPSSVLFGTVDSHRVAALGHSSGGGTALNALHNPDVATAVGWSPDGLTTPPSHKPIMFVVASGDTANTPTQVRALYDRFPGPKSFVEISGEGHNTYTDICGPLRHGGGIIGLAEKLKLIDTTSASWALNGCSANDIAPARFWRVVQYYTVFQLRARLNHGATSVPVPAKGAFPGFKVTLTQSAQ